MSLKGTGSFPPCLSVLGTGSFSPRLSVLGTGLKKLRKTTEISILWLFYLVIEKMKNNKKIKNIYGKVVKNKEFKLLGINFKVKEKVK